MKRLLFGFALAIAIVYGLRRLMGEEAEPQPSWTGTDNDPEDLGSVDDDLLARTREQAVQEQSEASPEAEPRQS
jgi:hypothetical protein